MQGCKLQAGAGEQGEEASQASLLVYYYFIVRTSWMRRVGACSFSSSRRSKGY